MEQSALKAVMSELGKRSWKARKKRHGMVAMRATLSSIGKQGYKGMKKALKNKGK